MGGVLLQWKKLQDEVGRLVHHEKGETILESLQLKRLDMPEKPYYMVKDYQHAMLACAHCKNRKGKPDFLSSAGWKTDLNCSFGPDHSFQDDIPSKGLQPSGWSTSTGGKIPIYCCRVPVAGTIEQHTGLGHSDMNVEAQEQVFHPQGLKTVLEEEQKFK
ncbi:ino80 complex subunit c [Limosa lapponica baueri]|uniref:Ino80 complex subunit c n=1 Tax=Limosa lapponica baueri TaxID=1758121 RepID=A0A2I0UL17_LIMLA|nr:ino80 complex subunit c [Limosa lapponica baueri]